MKLLLPLLPSIYFFQTVVCWGDLGHRTVAYLAQKYLSNEAAQLIDVLLSSGDGEDISDAAVWADEIRTHFPFTRPWHFFGILQESLHYQY